MDNKERDFHQNGVWVPYDSAGMMCDMESHLMEYSWTQTQSESSLILILKQSIGAGSTLGSYQRECEWGF